LREQKGKKQGTDRSTPFPLKKLKNEGVLKFCGEMWWKVEVFSYL
jgi:hypothetical protein